MENKIGRISEYIWNFYSIFIIYPHLYKHREPSSFLPAQRRLPSPFVSQCNFACCSRRPGPDFVEWDSCLTLGLTFNESLSIHFCRRLTVVWLGWWLVSHGSQKLNTPLKMNFLVIPGWMTSSHYHPSPQKRKRWMIGCSLREPLISGHSETFSPITSNAPNEKENEKWRGNQ